MKKKKEQPKCKWGEEGKECLQPHNGGEICKGYECANYLPVHTEQETEDKQPRKYRIEEKKFEGDNGSEYTPQYSDYQLDGKDVWETFTDWVGVGVIIHRCYTFDDALAVITQDKRSEKDYLIKHHYINTDEKI